MAEAVSDIWDDIEEAIDVIAQASQALRLMMAELHADEHEQAGKEAYAYQQEGGTLPPGSARAESGRRSNGTIHAAACGRKSLNNLISENSVPDNLISGNFGSHSEKGSYDSGDGSHFENIGSSSEKGSHSDSAPSGMSAEAYALAWGATPQAAQAWADRERLERAEVLLAKALDELVELREYRALYGPLPEKAGSTVMNRIPGEVLGQGRFRTAEERGRWEAEEARLKAGVGGKKPDWPIVHCPACGGARKWKQGKVKAGWVRRCEECGGEE